VPAPRPSRIHSLYLLATRRDSKLSRSPAGQRFKRRGVIGVRRLPDSLEPAAICTARSA